ncbi:hypothetical protein PPL_12181 [Heterostelium album PN500]|uniref:Prolyl 4-hydroxylase alpha subunit domain-containing protein n=1 Tax=Heterostelium pallidum (strain ATCC 26659 / Pp 5 / PN500) TaxID=670386 RepID=D3BLX7_HETP5|nr:hypothetical protein PPL_12181 [Heterostelium album PN500]EFA77578.1 hypothetical protein PPL_12181 [Heterostelium album PN500]|eukprot:XP_020429706.1 hypothetical protein PPL_12181 [Heterostelium album PN500]
MEEPLVIEGQVVKPMLFPSETPSDAKPIVKNDIEILKPNVAFVLDNVLSPSECQFIIDQGEEMGFDDLKHYTSKYRGNVRILVKTKSLSDVVLERIRPYLEQRLDIKPGSNLTGPMMRAYYGQWELSAINDLWRLCKYNHLGKFAAHYDGHYIQDNDNRSYLTFMIYLSEGIEGGSTRFLDNKSNKILAEVVPKAGSVLVFQHDMWHDGDVVKNGLKYIIRSDVMYRRLNSETKAPQLESEQTARKLCQEAILLEKTDPTGAAALFRRAFKLHPPLEEEY